nr:ras-related protein Rab-32 isoform X1 [Danio rerio]XP_021328754.1 ras-related protein Rab-32 isoform X1 [Danio rerio]|eukprot:XP_021322961.1 ras-related protein Rab-32 isoform X1 [Danio rerio]
MRKMSGDSELGCTEHLFKVLVIGDHKVGKSSFVKLYVRNQFYEELKTSIGVDFSMKVIDWDAHTRVRLQFWDIAGQERVRGLNRVYFRGSSGAFVVYDLTSGSSLDGALNWKRELDCQVMLKNGHPIPAVLLANKCDETKVSRRNASLLEKLCQEKGFTGCFQTSAKPRAPSLGFEAGAHPWCIHLRGCLIPFLRLSAPPPHHNHFKREYQCG